MKEAVSMEEHGVSPRHRTVAVDVGGVIVGGGAPIVVQSMTNTDTADIEATVAAGGGAGARRLGDRAHHGRPRRGGGGRAAHPRPPASAWASTCRSSATSTISATSCWPIIRPAPRRSTSTASIRAMSASGTRRDRQFGAIIETGDQIRQAGAHRRQLGLARPGAADPADGRERALADARSTRAR